MELYGKAAPIAFDWNVDEETYRRDPRLNFHTLAKFHRDPKLFYDGFFNDEEETDAMRFGTALHAKILEPERFGEKVAIFRAPVNPKTGEPFGATTKAFMEARSEFLDSNMGKTIISFEDAKTIERLSDSYIFHPAAPKLLKDATTEQSVAGLIAPDGIEPVAVKGRIDAYSPAGLIDLKTTAQLDDATGKDRFRTTLYSYKYLVQLAFYHAILTRCYNAPFCPVWLVVFEKNPPHRVAVYSPSREVLEKAYQVVDAWLGQWQDAQKTKRYRSKFDNIQIVDSYNNEFDF